MKFICIASLLMALVVAACQKKAVPVITQRKTAPFELPALYPPDGTVVPDTILGKTVFTGRCSRCHGLPDLLLYNEEKWENILASMIPRAGIPMDNRVHLRAYVLANSARE
jgi:hypothetical protein